MKLLKVVLVTLLFSAVAQAAPKVKQVDTNRNRVAVTATSQTAIGSEWVITNKDGSQCTLVVDDKIGDVAVLKPSSCSLSKVKVGQTLTKSVFSSSKSSSSSDGNRVVTSAGWNNFREQIKGASFILFYSMADEVPGKEQGVGFTANGETAWGFGAEYEYFLGDAVEGIPMGIVGGLTYELSREFSSVKSAQGTQQYQTKPAFALWDIYANGQVNLTNRVSALAGLNYPIALEKNFGGEKLKSKLGYQIGGSVKLTPQFGVDAMYRWVNLKTASISEMELNGFVLRGRYIF